jgi:hypothetical protein
MEQAQPTWNYPKCLDERNIKIQDTFANDDTQNIYTDAQKRSCRSRVVFADSIHIVVMVNCFSTCAEQ